ncbi:MAG TPA: hypothetical protein VJT73_04140 [Polyangiaceae bacterium]|nr:hypothetical protein [Polyangiaceae bacterium]
MRRAGLVVLLSLVASPAIAATSVTEDAPESLFRKGAAALAEGSINDAVDTFEALADRGFVHPDASFDRSLCYLGRVKAGIERPGDLGRAAAALEETLAQRPDDREAESALELVRAEVARRRARSGSSTDVEARPTIERAVLSVVSEWTWSILAALSSLVLTIGLVLRMRASGAREDDSVAERSTREMLQLASVVAVPLGALCLLVFGLFAAGARHMRLTTTEGVIVAPEAHLVTEKGVLTSAAAIPEAARVEIGEQRGSLVHVRWGSVEGWTQSDAIRRLVKPSLAP